MVSMARIAREDRNLTQDDDRVVEEMVQVLDLETDIANVSANLPQWEPELGQKWKIDFNELVYSKKLI